VARVGVERDDRFTEAKESSFMLSSTAAGGCGASPRSSFSMWSSILAIGA